MRLASSKTGASCCEVCKVEVMGTEVAHCYIYLDALSNTCPMPSTPQP